jgi:acyl-CoA synthetase (AMP-forming)/AMP-acid ligase II
MDAEASHLDAWALIPWAAQRYRDRLAIVDLSTAGSAKPEGAGLLTYAQLGERCAQLASHMASAWGVRRGTRVGVMLRNSAEVVEAHFAAAAAHAIVVNVNVSLAPRELAHVLRDSGCHALIADAEFADTVAAALAIAADAEAQQGRATPADGPPQAQQGAACFQLKTVAWVHKAAPQPSTGSQRPVPPPPGTLGNVSYVQYAGETASI